jgi:uncharacterized protein YndB with AHSA1/START domain
MSELELTISHTIAAPREKVFNAWLSPEMLGKFMRGSKDFHVTRAETDPVKGGRFSIVMATAEKEIPHAGTYLEIDPYQRIAFTWESAYSRDDSVVTIDLAEIDSRTTEITLKQIRFVSEEAREGHREGWTTILEQLSDYFSATVQA